MINSYFLLIYRYTCPFHFSSIFPLTTPNIKNTCSKSTLIALILLSTGYFSVVQAQITSPPNPCDDGTQATCQCETAPILCTIDDLDGFTYSMSDFQHPQNGPNPLCNGSGVPNNPTWFGFIAWCEELTLTAELSNCEPGCTGPFCSGMPSCAGFCFESDGIQIVVYSDCVNFNSVACNVNDCGNENDKTLNMTGLEIGEVYYFMVDGCAGSFCDVTINVIGTCGSAEIEDWTNPIDGPDEVCLGTSELFTVDDLEAATQYHWYLDGSEFQITSDPFNEIFFDQEGTFELCVDASNPPCIEVTAEPEPVCMTIEVVFPEDFLGSFDVCSADIPFESDGLSFFEDGIHTYIVTSPEGCDTLKILELNIIENTPEPRDTFVCIDIFPFFYPPLGENVFTPGEYVVEAEDEFGCDSTYIIIFREMVFEQLIQASQDTLRCPGEQITLSSFENVYMNDDFLSQVTDIHYEWLFEGEPIPGAMGPNALVDEEGEYTLVLTGTFNGVACTDTATFFLPAKFEFPPRPEPMAPDDVCVNTSREVSVLNYTAGVEVNWSVDGPANIAVSEDSLALIEFTVAGEVTICAEFEKANCEELTSDSCIVVNVAPGFSIELASPDYFCEGDSLLLQLAGTFDSVFWAGNAGPNEFLVTEAGPVQISVIDSLGCVSDTTIEIHQEANPIPEILGSPEFCEEGFTELTVEGNFVEINWSTGVSGPTSEIDTEGTISVEVTDELGCSGSNSIEVTLADDLGVSILGPSEICAGQSAELTLSASFAEVEWSTGSDSDTILATDAGLYTVEVSDGRGCFGNDSFNLTVNSLPTGEFQPEKNGLCPGESIEIQFETNDNISQYIWPDSSTSPQWATDSPGLVQLSLIDENGCVDSFSIELSAFEDPEPLLEGDSEICSGETITLSVTEDFEAYNWSTGESERDIEVSAEGIYSVIVTDTNGCSGTAEFEVIEHPLPDPTITGDLEVCEGESSTLSTDTDYEQYNWSTGSGNPEITLSESQFVTVEVTDQNNCSNTAEANFLVNPLPEINFIGSTTFCTGFSTIINIENYPEIEWNTGETSSSITINQEGTYSVTVTDANGCENENSIFITEDEELQPTIGGEPGFCPGESTVLEAGDGFATYQWSPGQSTSSVEISEVGTYTVVVTDSDGCTGSASVSVIEYDPPEPEISGTDFLCFEQTGMLEVADIYDSYNWSTGSQMPEIEVPEGGIYSITVSDANACTGTAEIDVTQNPEIIPEITGSSEICADETAVLEAETGFQNYSWSTGGEESSIQTGTEGVYSLTVTDANGCKAENSFELLVNELPAISTGPPKELNCITEQVIIGDPELDEQPGLIYEWLNEDQTTLLAEGVLFEVDSEGIYVFRITATNTGCISTEAAEVTRDPSDITGFQLAAGDPLCFGEESGFFEVTDIDGGTPPFEYILNGESFQSESFPQLPAGTYDLQIIDEVGCRVDTVITLADPSQVSVSLGSNLEIQVGESTVIEGEVSIGPDRIELIRWLINQNPYCDPCDELEIRFEEPTTSTVTLIVSDINGCIASDQITVSVFFNRNVYIPNAFSPNEDGVNDAFVIYGDGDLFEVEKMRVFDRWGSQVYESHSIPPNDPEFGWDGTFRGEKMNPGIYVYHVRVRFIDGEVLDLSGDILLTE